MAAVDVSLAREADGLDDVAPVAQEGGHLLMDIAADEPVAGLLEVVGGGIVCSAARCPFSSKIWTRTSGPMARAMRE